jgi:uncharacterized membrane protein (DUF485 family)
MERTTVDWQAVERSPEFRQLVRRRNGFLVAATAVWLPLFLGYLLLGALAPDLMGNEVVFGFTLGFVLSALQVFMTWAVAFAYLRKADREFEPLEQRAREVAAQATRAGGESR